MQMRMNPPTAQTLRMSDAQPETAVPISNARST